MTEQQLHEMLKSGDAHISPVSAANSEKVHTDEYDRKTRPAKRQAANTGCIYIPVTPVSKPRMTQRDKWKKRPCVLRYRAYCDALRKFWQDAPSLPLDIMPFFTCQCLRAGARKRRQK